MKNKINLICVLLSALIISCGGKDTPKSVAEKFLQAMGSQDFESAKKYGTEETEKLLDMMNGIAKMSPDTAKKEVKFEILNEKITGENAIVFYKEDGREGELQLPMVKLNGQWKVLLTKESINSSEGTNSMDLGATSTDTLSR